MAKIVTCWRCKTKFESQWSDEEAMGEYRRNFPDNTPTEAARDKPLCDACYDEFWEWARDNAPGLSRNG